MTYIASLKISFNSTYTFVNRQFLRHLSPLQQKVSLVAAAIFSCVAMAYIFHRCCQNKTATHLNQKQTQALQLKDEGNTLRTQGKYTEAAVKFKESLNLDDNVKTLKVYADTLLMVDPKEAEIVFKEVLEIAPQDPFALSGQGEVLRMQGRYVEAIEAFQKAEKLEPKDIRTLNGHAYAAHLLGRYEEASEYFQKVLAEDAENISALSGYADTLSRQGKWNEAVDQFQVLLSLEPNHTSALNSYGDTLIKMNDCVSAIKQFEEVLKIEPQNLWALRGQAESLYASGAIDEAATKVEELLKIEPQNAADFINQGLALMIIVNKPNEAKVKLEAALQLRPQHFFACIAYIEVVYNKLNNKYAAIRQLQQIIKLSPDSVSVLIRCGQILIALGELREALTQFNKILKIDPANKEALTKKDHCLTFIQLQKKN